MAVPPRVLASGRSAVGIVQFGGCRIPALAAVLAPEGGAVGQDGVDLPPFAVGRSLDPELVLPGVAAGGVALVDRGQPGPAQTQCCGGQQESGQAISG